MLFFAILFKKVWLFAVSNTVFSCWFMHLLHYICPIQLVWTKIMSLMGWECFLFLFLNLLCANLIEFRFMLQRSKDTEIYWKNNRSWIKPANAVFNNSPWFLNSLDQGRLNAFGQHECQSQMKMILAYFVQMGLGLQQPLYFEPRSTIESNICYWLAVVVFFFLRAQNGLVCSNPSPYLVLSADRAEICRSFWGQCGLSVVVSAFTTLSIMHLFYIHVPGGPKHHSF